MLSVIKIGIEPKKKTNHERKNRKNIKHNQILIKNINSIEKLEKNS